MTSSLSHEFDFYARHHPRGNPKKRYVGSVNKDFYQQRFHDPRCYWANEIPLANEIWFEDKQAAIRQGRRACSSCRSWINESTQVYLAAMEHYSYPNLGGTNGQAKGEVRTGPVVGLNTVVLIEFGDYSKERFTLVMHQERDISRNLLSIESPLGQSIMGKRSGDFATFGSETVKIVDVARISHKDPGRRT